MKFCNSILSSLFLIAGVSAQLDTGPEDPRIQTALTLDVPTNGVSTLPDGRLFLVLARVDGSKGAQVVEVFGNRSNPTLTPYPNEEWNSYSEGKDPATHFVRINSQRIGPDGNLWVVDVGAPSFGSPVIFPGGPKLVQINTKTNNVTRVYSMANATRSDSLLDDVRFNPSTGLAYLTDAGSPGIIVLDLASGFARRVLNSEDSTKGATPISAEGSYVLSSSGGFSYIYADQMEVSPDAKYYYFQPSCGGMSRVETKWLDAAYYNSSLEGPNLEAYVEPFSHTPSTGGTAIDADGNIYNSNTDNESILKIAPNGTKYLLAQDPRLLWVDAMWISTDKKLWMPAAQLNRGTPFGNGKSNITKPLHVYTIDIGVGPPAIDHA